VLVTEHTLFKVRITEHTTTRSLTRCDPATRYDPAPDARRMVACIARAPSTCARYVR